MRGSQIILLAMLLSLSALEGSSAALPDDRKLDPTVDQMIASLKQQVPLTDEQTEKVRPIFEYNLKKREEFYKREKQGASKKKIRQDVRALQVEVEARILKILTPEQLKNLTAVE